MVRQREGRERDVPEHGREGHWRPEVRGRGQAHDQGNARDVVVPVSLTQAAGTTTATGSFVIKRLDFKIGDGDWADTSMVANDVQVKFKLTLTGVPSL